VQSISQLEHKYGREESQTITDNCHCWIYLKTANVETASQITKKLGQYTTSSYSRSNSYNSSGTSSGNVSNSMNLIARSLLTEDEILRIERPFALVMYAGQYPAIMRLPDLSEWKFNRALGLGDKEHNRKLREIREKSREARKPAPIELWGIWDKYQAKKRTSTDFGEYAEPEPEYAAYTGDGETMRIPARVFPGIAREKPSGAVSMAEAARAGRQIDEMFTQFKKANGQQSKKDMERIDKL
jgi:hypothetical protein